MNYDTYLNGVWKLDFRSASDGFVKEQNMMIEDANTQMLHADISCGTVPDGASLILWLVQGDVSKSGEQYSGETDDLLFNMLSESDNEAANTLVRSLGNGDADDPHEQHDQRTRRASQR